MLGRSIPCARSYSPIAIHGSLLTIFAFLTLVFLYFHFIAGLLLVDTDFSHNYFASIKNVLKLSETEILMNSSLHDSTVNAAKGENG